MQFDVGVVRVSRTLDPFTTALLTLSRAYDLRVCSFALSELNTETTPMQADALYWNGRSLARTTAELPPLCEARFNPLSSVRSFPPSLAEKLARLSEETVFTEYNGLGKTAVSLALLQTPLYELAIPTYLLNGYAELRKYAALLKRAILKPSGGRKGRHVCRLDLCGAPPVLSCNGSAEDFSQDDWDTYCAALEQERLGCPILQPRLDFRLDDAHAVDFRLLVCRGADGGWEKVAIYARVGADGTVSNLSHGGYVADAGETLRLIAPERSESLLAALEEYCVTIPETLQQFLRTTVSCLGLDIGVDRATQRPYLLEANTIPGTKYHAWQLAEAKLRYFTYLLEHPPARP